MSSMDDSESMNISNNMDDTCLEHGVVECEVVCIEEACKGLNQGQPVPVCLSCIEEDHDMHKTRSWRKVKRNEIRLKKTTLKKTRLSAIPLLRNSIKYDTHALTTQLKISVITECTSTENQELIQESNRLTRDINDLQFKMLPRVRRPNPTFL